MIFLVQFGINKHSLIFSKTANCTHPTDSLVWNLIFNKKFTRAYFFQIALEIMWLPILILHKYRPLLQVIDRWGCPYE